MFQVESLSGQITASLASRHDDVPRIKFYLRGLNDVPDEVLRPHAAATEDAR